MTAAVMVRLVDGPAPLAAAVTVTPLAFAVVLPGGKVRYYSRHDGRGFGCARGSRVHPADVTAARRALGVPRG